MFLPQRILKTTIKKLQTLCIYIYIYIYVYIIYIFIIYIYILYICHSYDVTSSYTRMSSVCHSYVLVCFSYVTRLWFYHKPFRSPRSGVKLIWKIYVSTHLKHFAKYEIAISELRAASQGLYAWLKRAEYCSIWTKYSWITAKEPDCYPSN